jgi:cell filamentation protein, protein adenylyltransferase
VQVERFQTSPIGRLVPIQGHDARLGRDYDHFAYVPDPLPQGIILAQSTYSLLSEADRALGGLDAKTELLPNPRLLVRPALTKEAVATSALEGTYAPLSDVLEADYIKAATPSSEVREIRNYIMAATRGLELIATRPICVSMLSELQRILVQGTRGDSYDSGQLRERQVCIGDEGLGIEDSRFVPPPQGELLSSGMDDWEKWINSDIDIPLLVKAAVGHYQFETLHPFSDGNGRLGRLVITLQIMQAGALKYPILNLSTWLEPRRTQYIDHLLDVSATGDFDPWVAFFAQAVKARADAASEAISKLLAIRQEFTDDLRRAGCRGSVVTLAGDLIGFPVLDVPEARDLLGVSYQAANSAVGRLVEFGILRQVSRGGYGRVFRCERVFEVIANA